VRTTVYPTGATLQVRATQTRGRAKQIADSRGATQQDCLDGPCTSNGRAKEQYFALSRFGSLTRTNRAEDIGRAAGATRIATGACSISSRSARNGKSRVPRFREALFRKDSRVREPVSPNPRWENSEFSLRGGRDFGSSGRRGRSRESAARPIPFRAANAAANYCRTYCEFFHSKGVNAEATPKLNEILERVVLSQAQAKSALTTQRAKVRTKRL
jgi:hypothetical protein